MKDDLARLKAALLAKVPQAPAAVREQAISAVLEHHSIHRQIASTPDDELANLKSAFRNSVPQAPPSVRNRAIYTAKEYFNLHIKGNGIDKRHIDKALKPSALNSYV